MTTLDIANLDQQISDLDNLIYGRWISFPMVFPFRAGGWMELKTRTYKTGWFSSETESTWVPVAGNEAKVARGLAALEQLHTKRDRLQREYEESLLSIGDASKQSDASAGV